MKRARSRPDGAGALAAADIAAGARSLGLTLTDIQAERLARYAALLQRWNAVHNLTAIEGPAQVLTHHLLDSVAIVPSIASIFGQKPIKILDVGAGGGLPGLPVAITRPDWHVTLVDKVQKKVAFLTQAKLDLALDNVEAVHARVETLRSGPYDVVIARAFAALADFVGRTAGVLAPGGVWAAMKAGVPNDELTALRQSHPAVRVVDIVKLAVPRLDAERHLILLQPS